MRRVVVFGGIAVALLHPAQWRAPDRIGSPRVAHDLSGADDGILARQACTTADKRGRTHERSIR